jgi:hypothetical protein
MFILRKPAKPHALGEPLLHENHKRPTTRREFLGAGMISAPAMVIAPAWVGALLKSGTANAALSPDIFNLGKDECGVKGAAAAGGLPFIAIDLAGGANLVGSEVLVGQKGNGMTNPQLNFLSTAGYGKLGIPGNMVPTSSAFISTALGIAWHSDGAILRGIMSKATTPATAAGTNGAVFCALSQNDTGNNPHNPIYGIAKAGATGQVVTLIGSQNSASGGNSMAPANEVDATLTPTKIATAADAVGLAGSTATTVDPVNTAILESQARISGGAIEGAVGGALSAPAGVTPGVMLSSDPTADAALKKSVRCAYVKTANAADSLTASQLDPTKDTNIIGGATPIFTAADFKDNDVAKTAAVMKLVLGGFAGAGTISLGGYDYHDSTRATGETRNFKAGQMIGAILEYAQRVGSPVMIYVFSDGSLSSSSMIDTSTAGRNKLAWQGDNQSTASTFTLVYSPQGRPQLLSAAQQQIGYFSADGNVVSTSSAAANSVTQLAETAILNYMALKGTSANFQTVFPKQGLGATVSQMALTAFAPIV